MSNDHIRIRGASQNNLKYLDLDLPLGELIVVTGVSGSGKSSLAFDTLYAEGQRRYVETFSPYARQFLDRMDRPRVERIEGIPPAIAIDQVNPVRTSRSTVGTMTELADHLKLLFARTAGLYCGGCGRRVTRDTPQSVADRLIAEVAPGTPVMLAFRVTIPDSFDEAEIRDLLSRQGYARVETLADGTLQVTQDRFRLDASRRDRLLEGLEAAFRHGRGRAVVHPLDDNREPGEPWRFSADLHCPDCDIHHREPIANLFSFNSPVGACETCRGFGRTMGIDYDLVIPDDSLTLARGAVRVWQSQAYGECQDDLIEYADQRGIPIDTPWRELSPEQRAWVIEGEGGWDDGVWYGVRRFFDWLESRSYKMHVRVQLSRYRSYDQCPACNGARLKTEALLWRLGNRSEADAVLDPERRFRPHGIALSDERLRSLAGLNLHDLMQLPIRRCLAFFDALGLPAPLDQASAQLLGEIRSRLRYLDEVGLGYLTLDRQSRTLSGGEVQRINLTTALGTSLVNALFVLDEPSIGLHPRDMDRVIGVLTRLRDAGNTLVVVEHDPQVMRSADRILDLGPGPGERGGEIVAFGPPAELMDEPRSLTGRYLSGARRLSRKRATRKPAKKGDWLQIRGATAHNLKNLDVDIPLGRLVGITGVSGSGKSTLIGEVLHRGLLKRQGRPTEAPGAHDTIHGAERIKDVVLVDQSPIGKTARSNPLSYVGALDAVRKLYAAEPLAKERGYTAGTFSFNAGNGRCPSCQGSGFEHVEMQFLSDVYLRCPDCDGRRYRAEVLQVKLRPGTDDRGYSIADVLELTVTEALTLFADYPEVQRALAPLAAVGLGYLRLGQPVPTLSGGEAQRLKLAGHLAAARKGGTRKGAAGKGKSDGATLFLFDEPTTGLHFEDIGKLLDTFDELLEQGHTLVVIEHNLDVIAAADWLIDLGPEGGEGGGELVCAGTPAQVMGCEESHTGRALRSYKAVSSSPSPLAGEGRPASGLGRGGGDGLRVAEAPTAYHRTPVDLIRIHNAREHNLRNIDVDIPHGMFTVITGVSGSGKSTVAFDILFAEGQRRYLESLNAYARQFVQPAARPEVDAVRGIPPTVAIEQRTSRGGRKSTVGTLTEIHHFLRLLFVKLGTQYCPDCNIPIEPQSTAAILARLLKDYKGQRIDLLAPLVTARKGYYTDLAQWAANKGFGELRVDGAYRPTGDWPRLDRFKEHTIELPVGECAVAAKHEIGLRRLLEQALDYGKGVVRVLAEDGREALFSTERACPGCGTSFAELDPRLFSYNSKHGWCTGCFGTGLQLKGFDEQQSGEETSWNAWYEGEARTCPSCRGQRLNPLALAVRYRERSIADYAALPVVEAEQTFRKLKPTGREAAIARDILAELRARLQFLKDVGLGYLSLDRAAPTLSGGEAQRIRLAAQLGSNLRGVCYILDEPTIGLHPRDNRMLLETLGKLESKGNTVVVVEHDEDTIRRAEHLIDLGPGAGRLGGHVVAAGTLDDLLAGKESVTGRCLAEPLRHPLLPRRPVEDAERLRIESAGLHNLAGLDVEIPLGRLVCVTGVSGGGKSTLVREVLHENLQRLMTARRTRKAMPEPHGCRTLNGWESLKRVLEVDQTPIGKTPRSCPATYVGLWDGIRKLFAATEEARLRGYQPGRFSFNTPGGRCEACEGQGMKRIEMSFLPDVQVPCEVCRGARFDAETLAVRWKALSIAEVLAMSIEDAVGFFTAQSAIHHTLQLLVDVGLGYLTLGQPSPTLSGGEAQRIKLVTELAKARPEPDDPRQQRRSSNATLYLLDEPTVGLHMADVEKLIRVLHRLVEAGNSVVVIEHNLDVIAEADWIIDLGPEGGFGGGRIVAEGPPEAVAKVRRDSRTATFLREFLAQRAG